jgi:hypothetical protein
MRLFILAIFALLVGCETAPQQYQAPLSQKEQCFADMRERAKSCMLRCVLDAMAQNRSSASCGPGCDDRKDAMQDRCNRM